MERTTTNSKEIIMLSCLSNCCPTLFRRNTTVQYQSPPKVDSKASTPETNRRHTGLPPLSTQPVTNYNSISPPTSNAILTKHQSKLTLSELRATNPNVASSFYITIPKELCTKEFGKNLIKQIFNSHAETENKFNLALMCIKHIPANNDVKRELQIETRNTMCKTFIINQRTSLRLLDTYYKSIDLTDPTVVKNEKDAIPTLGSHREWNTEANKALDSAITECTSRRKPQHSFLSNIELDTMKRDQLLNGRK